MKQTQFKIGDIIEVTINNIVGFGVFCKCPNNYTGLIHISNISNSFVNNVEDYFSNDETIKVEIISIDNDNKKFSLSTKKFNIIAKKRIRNKIMKFWTKIILDDIKNEIEPYAVCKNNDKFIKNKILNDNYPILLNEKTPLLKNKQIIKSFEFSSSALIKINKQNKIDNQNNKKIQNYGLIS